MSNPISIDLVRQVPERCGTLPSDGRPLGFGRYFTDHFFHSEFTGERGWHHAIIEPFKSLTVDPAALCFHYGQTIFEGLKAYRGRDGKVRIFRLDRSGRRFSDSATRLGMEPVPQEFYERAVSALTLVDRNWIPTNHGESLYLRPVMVSTDPYVGVKPGTQFLFYVLAGPTGAMFSQDFRPVRILVEDQDVRAVRGGLGAAKTGANYAHGMRSQQRAAAQGYAQVLWLDALERRYVEEVGSMNIFFVVKGELVTPPLGGTILPGITRDSILTLARAKGMKVSERKIAIDEVLDGIDSGDVTEVFGTGTAAIVCPVGVLAYKGVDHTIPGSKSGPVTQMFFDEMSAIQRGEAEDRFGWVRTLNEEDLGNLLG